MRYKPGHPRKYEPSTAPPLSGKPRYKKKKKRKKRPS